MGSVAITATTGLMSEKDTLFGAPTDALVEAVELERETLPSAGSELLAVEERGIDAPAVLGTATATGTALGLLGVDTGTGAVDASQRVPQGSPCSSVSRAAMRAVAAASLAERESFSSSTDFTPCSTASLLCTTDSIDRCMSAICSLAACNSA